MSDKRRSWLQQQWVDAKEIGHNFWSSAPIILGIVATVYTVWWFGNRASLDSPVGWIGLAIVGLLWGAFMAYTVIPFMIYIGCAAYIGLVLAFLWLLRLIRPSSPTAAKRLVSAVDPRQKNSVETPRH